MDGKPLHYDCSLTNVEEKNPVSSEIEQFQISDEMRKSISGNPYEINING